MEPKMSDELREAREWRLKEEHDRKYHPVRTKIEDADRFMRAVLRLAPFVALALLIISTRGLTWTTAIISAALIFERRIIWRGLIRGSIGAWMLGKEIHDERAKRSANDEQAQRLKASADRLQPANDTFAGKPIMEIAETIAASGQPVITKESLAAALEIPIGKADDLRKILLNSQFLLYPITGDVSNARPIGSEMIAFKDEFAKRATTIHPTLMNAPATQRALVIANAIRRTLQFSVGEEPRIMGEPSPACQFALGLTGSHLTSARPDKRRVPVDA